jgi:hypothetical protein
MALPYRSVLEVNTTSLMVLTSRHAMIIQQPEERERNYCTDWLPNY